MPKLSEILFGKKEKFEQRPTGTPQQQALQNQLLKALGPLLQQGTGNLKQLLDLSPEGTERYAAPFKRQFEEQVIPGLAERFSSMDAQRSSAFGQQLGAAGAGLEEQLAALQGQLSQQGMSNLFQLLTSGMQPQQQTFYRPASGGLLQGLIQSIGENAGDISKLFLAQAGLPGF